MFHTSFGYLAGILGYLGKISVPGWVLEGLFLNFTNSLGYARTSSDAPRIVDQILVSFGNL